MSDVTSSVTVEFGTIQGDPYVRTLELARLHRQFAGPGRLSGGAVTVASDVVTIPAGSEFLLALDNQRLLQVTIVTALTIVATDDHFTGLQAILQDDGSIVIDLTSQVTAVPTGALTVGQKTGVATFVEDASLDKRPANILYLYWEDLTVDTAKSIRIICPVGGRVRRCRTIVDTALVGAGNAVYTAELGGTLITGFSVTVLTTAAADVEDDSGVIADSATNKISAGEALEIINAGAVATSGIIRGVVEIEQ